MSTSQPWLPMPSLVRRLFSAFPLHTFPSAPLPISCPSPNQLPRLYIYNGPSDELTWDAECLRWQTFLCLMWKECIFVSSSLYASPSRELPLLVLPGASPEIIPLHKLHDTIVSKFGISVNPRVAAYINIVDTKLRAAWVLRILPQGINIQVFAFYLTEAYKTVTLSLLSMPRGIEPLQYLVRYSHRAHKKEELERRSISQIHELVLYSEADEGYAALSILLGANFYFFNEKQPGLMDTAVFAYTWTVLDRLPESNLASIIRRYDNLVRHAVRVKELVNSAYTSQRETLIAVSK